MTEEQFTFLSSDSHTQINAKRWKPSGSEPTKILQITHGMIEYIDRYSNFAKYLTNFGFLVVGHDHLGHGNSVQSTNDWGYFGPNPSDLLVEDMHKLRQNTQNLYKNLPYFMLGHSMGSFMLRKYLSLHSDGLSGAIIMGTGYHSPCKMRMSILIAKNIACFHCGDRYKSSFLENQSFGSKYYDKYDQTGKDPYNSWLTKDPEIVKFYYNEPRCTFKFTVNGYIGLFEAVKFSCQPDNIEKINKELPIFLVAGSDDPVGDCGKGVKAVYDLMIHSGLKAEMKLYENDRHEILNETDKEKVYEDIKEWINNNINNKKIIESNSETIIMNHKGNK